MNRYGTTILRAYWVLTLSLLAAALAMVIWYVPDDPQSGPILRIVHIHLAAAINTLIACTVVFAANIAYLWQRDNRWDALGDAGARVVVLLCFVVLVTGMLWAKQAWGRWWQWNSPLTFSLILWLLYAGYLLHRRLPHPPGRRAMRSAAFGIVAFLDVPLVYLSVRMLPDSHLSIGERAPETVQTQIVWLLAVLFLSGGLIATRYLLTRLTSASDASTHAQHGPTQRPASPRMIA